MPKKAKQKRVKKDTWPRIKRSHKYQLLRQQAHYCVFKKNPCISHVKCESFLLHMTMMMRSFDRKAMHAQDEEYYRQSTIHKFIEEQSRWGKFHLWRDSKADV